MHRHHHRGGFGVAIVEHAPRRPQRGARRVDPSDVVLVSRRADALEDLAARGATVRHVTSVVTDSVGQRIQGALVAVDRRAAGAVEAELASITVCELVRETAAGELRRAG